MLGRCIVASGLCQRLLDPDDGRPRLIELTPAGRRLLTDATRTFVDELEVRLRLPLSERSLEQFAATVRELRQGLRARNEKNAPDRVNDATREMSTNSLVCLTAAPSLSHTIFVVDFAASVE